MHPVVDIHAIVAKGAPKTYSEIIIELPCECSGLNL